MDADGSVWQVLVFEVEGEQPVAVFAEVSEEEEIDWADRLAFPTIHSLPTPVLWLPFENVGLSYSDSLWFVKVVYLDWVLFEACDHL
jgi:hypothetical protein